MLTKVRSCLSAGLHCPPVPEAGQRLTHYRLCSQPGEYHRQHSLLAYGTARSRTAAYLVDCTGLTGHKVAAWDKQSAPCPFHADDALLCLC